MKIPKKQIQSKHNFNLIIAAETKVRTANCYHGNCDHGNITTATMKGNSDNTETPTVRKQCQLGCLEDSLTRETL